jgi:integrase
MTIDEIVNIINQGNFDNHLELNIIDYGRKIIKQMEADGHKGNASVYKIALNNLVKFAGEDISVQEITVGFINDWIKYLTDMPARPKRIRGTRAQSQYPATLRAIINRAKAEYNDEDLGLIRIPLSPFKKIKLPKVEQNRKRALELIKLQQLINLPYKNVNHNGFNRYNFAKDMFLLSFMLIGMNEVDMYYCDDCKDGRITYQRTKTKNRREDKAEISIMIQPEAKALIDKYRDPTGQRVFRFYLEYSSVDAFCASINKGLKLIGDDIKENDLEFYAARHTWATLAVNDAGIDKYVVHTALNHVDPTMKVTDLYIKKSWDPIDNANRKVIDLVNMNIDVSEPDREKYLLSILPKQNRKQKSSKNIIV